MFIRIVRIFLFVLILLVMISGLAISVVSSSAVQKSLIERYTGKLSKELGAKVNLGAIRLQPNGVFLIEDAYIGDQHSDTLFFIHETYASLRLLDLNKNLFALKSVELNDFVVNFVNYSGEEDFNYQFFFDYLSPDTPRDTTEPYVPFKLQFDKLTLNNGAFAMRVEDDTVEGRDFKENDFRFNNINGHLSQFHVVDDSLSFMANDLELEEKNSFKVRRLSTKARIHSRGMSFKQLTLVTPYSILRDELNFVYGEWSDWSEFNDKILMQANLKDSKVSFKDLAYFSDNLKGWEEEYYLSGKAQGPLSNIKSQEIHVTYGEHTELKGTFTLSGLPDVNATFMNYRLSKASSSAQELKHIIHQDLPRELEQLGVMSFKGAFTGYLEDFVAFGNFNTALGDFRTDINLKIADEKFSGTLALNQFDLGQMLGVKELGKVTLSSEVKGTGFTLANLEARINANAKQVDFNNYSYTKLTLNGLSRDKFFEGSFTINDPNAKLNFDGIISLEDSLPAYDFESNVYYANLRKLGFSGNRPFEVKGNMVINASGNALNNLIGEIRLQKVEARSEGRMFDIDSLLLVSQKNMETRTISLQSDVMDVLLVGKYELSELANSMNNYLAQLLPNTLKLSKVDLASQDFSFDVQLKRTRQLTELFQEGFWLDKGNASGSFDSDHNRIEFETNLSKVIYDSYDFRDIHVVADSSGDEHIHFLAEVKEIRNQDTTILHDFSVDLDGLKNVVKYDIGVASDRNQTKVALNGEFTFTDSSVQANFYNSRLLLDSANWRIDDSSIFILTRWKDLEIPYFRMANKGRSIRASGLLAGKEDDSLKLDFNKFDLRVLNPFLFPGSTDELGGIANGQFNVLSFKGEIPLFSSTLTVDHLSFNTDTFGDLSLQAGVKDQYRLIWVDGQIKNGTFSQLKLNGFVKTESRNSGYNLQVSLDSTALSAFEPFAEGLASEFKGYAFGDVHIGGTFNKPKIKGGIQLRQAQIKVDYLNTRYRFQNQISLSEDRIELGRFTIMDENNSIGKVDGYIAHDFFSDFRFNIELSKLNRFLVLNTNEEQNDLYYGKAIMTGSAKLSGTVDQLKIDVMGKTEKGSALYVPMDNYGGSSEMEFIQFVNFDEVGNYEPYKDLSGIEMDFDLDITPDAEIQLIFDSKLGDIIRARGSSDMQLKINSNGDFKMYGVYTVEEGDYLFTAIDLINKKYIIQKGGTISWQGDPLNATMDLEAAYRTRTSTQNLVEGLVSEEDLAAYRQKVEVEAVMKLQGDLMSPDIRFGIRIPNINSLTAGNGGTVNSSVLTNVLRRIENDQEEMTRQVFSLMVANVFIRPSVNQQFAGAGVSGYQAGLLSSSVGDLISNQISNLLSQIDSDWKLGINYEPGVNSSELLISASRKLFNDRLEIQGTFGTNNIYNNVSANYKVTPDGRLQLKAFNRTGTLQTVDNTVGTNQSRNRNINTQGIGFYYSIEFDVLSPERRAVRRALQQSGQMPGSY